MIDRPGLRFLSCAYGMLHPPLQVPPLVASEPIRPGSLAHVFTRFDGPLSLSSLRLALDRLLPPAPLPLIDSAESLSQHCTESAAATLCFLVFLPGPLRVRVCVYEYAAVRACVYEHAAVGAWACQRCVRVGGASAGRETASSDPPLPVRSRTPTPASPSSTTRRSRRTRGLRGRARL